MIISFTLALQYLLSIVSMASMSSLEYKMLRSSYSPNDIWPFGKQ